jgi:anti-sigma regulatory factor (Ser/Thr protein kinase)
VADPIEPAEQRSFPRSAASLPEIFEFMDAFFARAGVGDAHRLPIQFAVEELFTNLVKYSRGGTREIQLDLTRDGGRLLVSLTDFGVERFDIRAAPDVNVDLDLKDRKPGGLGIHLLKRMVDEIDYEYVDGRSKTTIVKLLG